MNKPAPEPGFRRLGHPDCSSRRRFRETVLHCSCCSPRAACSASTGSRRRPRRPPKAPPPPRGPGRDARRPGSVSRIDPDGHRGDRDLRRSAGFRRREYVKVDDRHIRCPILGDSRSSSSRKTTSTTTSSSPKALPEEIEAQAQSLAPQQPPAPGATPARRRSRRRARACRAADFEDLVAAARAGRHPARGGRGRPGLPDEGMWRASFVIADMNGDGIPDIVAPPARLGDGKLHVWIGDGKGSFTRVAAVVHRGRQALAALLDRLRRRRGRRHRRRRQAWTSSPPRTAPGWSRSSATARAASASSGRACRRGTSPRRPSRCSTPTETASSTSSASRDVPRAKERTGTSTCTQVRVYLVRRRARAGSSRRTRSSAGSTRTRLHAWDYDGDGRKDVLTGSHYTGALTLLWKNDGDGTFSPVRSDAIEIYAYHFATAPGTFGKERAAGLRRRATRSQANVPDPTRADGITLYVLRERRVDAPPDLAQEGGRRRSSTALAMGDLDGDGLDDVVFADNENRRVRILLQQAGRHLRRGSSRSQEPALDSPGPVLRLADVNGDGRLDVVLVANGQLVRRRTSRAAGTST